MKSIYKLTLPLCNPTVIFRLLKAIKWLDELIYSSCMEQGLAQWAAGVERRLAHPDPTDAKLPPEHLLVQASHSLSQNASDACARFPRLCMLLALHKSTEDSLTDAVLQTICTKSGLLHCCARVITRLCASAAGSVKPVAFSTAVAAICSSCTADAAHRCFASLLAACSSSSSMPSAIQQADHAQQEYLRPLERARKASICSEAMDALIPGSDGTDTMGLDAFHVQSLLDWNTASRWCAHNGATLHRLRSIITASSVASYASLYEWLPDWCYLPVLQDSLELEALAQACEHQSPSRGDVRQIADRLIQAHVNTNITQTQTSQTLLCFGLVSLLELPRTCDAVESILVQLCAQSFDSFSASIRALLEPHRTGRCTTVLSGLVSQQEANGTPVSKLAQLVTAPAKSLLLETSACTLQLERLLHRVPTAIELGEDDSKAAVEANPSYIAVIFSACEPLTLARSMRSACRTSASNTTALEIHLRAFKILEHAKLGNGYHDEHLVIPDANLLLLAALACVKEDEALESAMGRHWRDRIASAADQCISQLCSNCSCFVHNLYLLQHLLHWSNLGLQNVQSECEAFGKPMQSLARLAEAISDVLATHKGSSSEVDEKCRLESVEKEYKDADVLLQLYGNVIHVFQAAQSARELNTFLVRYGQSSSEVISEALKKGEELFKHSVLTLSETLDLVEHLSSVHGPNDSTLLDFCSSTNTTIGRLMQGSDRVSRCVKTLELAASLNLESETSAKGFISRCIEAVAEEVIQSIRDSSTTAVPPLTTNKCASGLAHYLHSHGASYLLLPSLLLSLRRECTDDQRTSFAVATNCVLQLLGWGSRSDALKFVQSNPVLPQSALWPFFIATRCLDVTPQQTSLYKHSFSADMAYLYVAFFVYYDDSAVDGTSASDARTVDLLRHSLTQSLNEDNTVLARTRSLLREAITNGRNTDVIRKAELFKLKIDALHEPDTMGTDRQGAASLQHYVDTAFAEPVDLEQDQSALQACYELDEVSGTLLHGIDPGKQMRAAHLLMIVSSYHGSHIVQHSLQKVMQKTTVDMTALTAPAIHVMMRLGMQMVPEGFGEVGCARSDSQHVSVLMDPL